MTGIQSKIASGFKGSAGPATAALGDEVNKNSSPFQSAIGKLGSVAKVGGIAIAAGIAAGVAGLAALTGKALMAGAELEQQLGGSEAVFGEFASGIQEKAKVAYKNAGLSQQEFLQGANKMGSLFQGAGFSVQQSMTMSADSMQRASDIASIMGISTTDALEAITGMAKGNFTMMDNLGVAMNDTALGAYALSKGINKSTTSMSIQEKVGLANQLFLEKTAKYAGNYAKENDTLSGSLNTTKKAFDNLLTGQGDVNDFIDSMLGTISIAVPKIVALLPKIVTGLSAVLNALVPALSAALPTLIPALIGAVSSLLQAVVAAFPSIVKVLVDALPLLIDAFIQLFLAIVKALPEIVRIITTAMPTIIDALVVGLTNPESIKALLLASIALLLALIQAIPVIVNAINASMPIIIKNITAVFTDPVFIAAMYKAGWQILKSLVLGIISMNMESAKVSAGVAFNILTSIQNALAPSKLEETGKNIVIGLWNGMQSLGGWLKDRVISFVRDKIPGPIRTALGISSPSKVAALLGKQVPAGLAQGIDAAAGLVSKAATNMANNALSGITGANMNAELAANYNPMISNNPALANSPSASIVQNNSIYNQVDLDSVTRELAWQIRR